MGNLNFGNNPLEGIMKEDFEILSSRVILASSADTNCPPGCKTNCGCNSKCNNCNSNCGGS